MNHLDSYKNTFNFFNKNIVFLGGYLKTLVFFYVFLFTIQNPDKDFIYEQKIEKDIENVRKARIAVEYCETKKVHLEDLPNLRSFSSGDIVKWSSLENVVLDHFPDIKKFGLGMIKESQLKSILITQNDEVQIHPHTNLAYLFELLVSSLSNIIYQNKTYTTYF